MIYDIQWDRQPGGAADQMQALITGHPHRRAEFASALRDFSLFVARYPHTLGSPDRLGNRVYPVHPLDFRYRIDDANRRVTVVGVRLWTP